MLGGVFAGAFASVAGPKANLNGGLTPVHNLDRASRDRASSKEGPQQQWINGLETGGALACANRDDMRRQDGGSRHCKMLYMGYLGLVLT